MLNLEVKARLDDIDRAESLGASLTGVSPERIRQVDTYFRSVEGRLKLRESESGAELIHYDRPDLSGPKACEYTITPVADPEQLKAELTSGLGVDATVEKERLLFMHRGIRIHLDRVDGLGCFLEIEAPLTEGLTPTEVEVEMNSLLELFSVGSEALVNLSYCDLVRELSERDGYP